MTKVLALDQSSATGWCKAGSKIDLPKWQTGRFKLPRRDELGERLLIAFNTTCSLIREWSPDLVALEAPYNPVNEIIAAARAGKPVTKAFNVETTNLLQMIRGAVITAAASLGVPTETYEPSTWRIDFIGYGRAPKGADKGHMKKAVFERVRMLGGQPANHDESDAWGIAYAACHGRSAAKRVQEDLFAKAVGAL